MTTLACRSSARGAGASTASRESCWSPARVLAMIPLVLILYYLVDRRASAPGAVDFFTTDPTGKFFGDPGGIKSAILGTIEMVALATAIAAPDRDRRRAVPDRVRPQQPLRARWCATSSTS